MYSYHNFYLSKEHFIVVEVNLLNITEQRKIELVFKFSILFLNI